MGEGINLKTTFSVGKLYGINYVEHAKGYNCSGEEVPFWRLFYIDKGELCIFAADKTVTLRGGECYILEPGTKHSVRADGENAGGLITVSFECTAGDFSVLNKSFLLANGEKRLLGNIIKEAKNAFSDFSQGEIVRRESGKNDAEQMIGLLLPMLLISIARLSFGNEKKPFIPESSSDMDIISSVISFLEENISEKLRFKDVAAHAKISATALKTLFVKRVGCGVMEYFTNLKTERAKRLIRENNYNFTEISRLLGYDSLHYFSRQFKKKTGMSPTQYANSAQMYINEE